MAPYIIYLLYSIIYLNTPNTVLESFAYNFVCSNTLTVAKKHNKNILYFGINNALKFKTIKLIYVYILQE